MPHYSTMTAHQMFSTRPSSDRWAWLTTTGRICAAAVSLGIVGLAAMLPSVRARRARRAARCAVCRRHQKLRRVVVAVLAVILLAGVITRVSLSNGVPSRCDATHQVAAATTGMPTAWRVTRDVVTAPLTGIVDAYAAARGMWVCSRGATSVAVLPHAAGTGGATGTTVGDLLIVHGPGTLAPEHAAAVGRHESRHTGQWTVFTMLAGPFSLPVLYGMDEAFFPGARNQFERAAGLHDGGYARPSGFGPAPQWGAVAAILGCGLLLARRRLRWCSRLVVDGRVGARRADPDRCPLHSRGWFRCAAGRGIAAPR